MAAPQDDEAVNSELSSAPLISSNSVLNTRNNTAVRNNDEVMEPGELDDSDLIPPGGREGAGAGGGSALGAPTSSMSARASAFRLLEQYFEADMLTLDQLQFLKEKYAKLHSCVLETYKHEKQLLKDAKALNRDLLGEKIQVEKQAIRKAEEVAAFTSVEREKERALKELAEGVDRDAMLMFEITELQKECADLVAEKEAILTAHAQLIEPEVRQLTTEIAGLGDEIHRVDSELAKDQQRKKEYLARLEFLRQENARLEQTGAIELKRLNQLQGDPERMQKQADVVARAVANLERESSRDRTHATELQTFVDTTTTKLHDADEVQRELNQKLEVHRETIDQRQRDVDHVTLHLREEQNINVMRLGEKTRLEMRGKALDLAARRENERCSKAQKDYDRLKRELKKQIFLYDGSKALLPNLRAQVVDAQHQLSGLRSENKEQAQRQLEVKEQVDLLIARFLKQEDGEKAQSADLDVLSTQVSELEAEVAQWLVEENKQKKLVTMLTAQRELKAREATSALTAERQTQQELKTKELVIFDLAKKWNETTNHLREFSALYDVVKNERNKYVNLIQASTQALAEMKEKIKILHNEVEVLRNESLAKDKALVKEKLAHSTAQCSRDSLRLDTNKSHDAYRTKQEQVEQQIVEIDKLNGIITHTEKELLRLKKKYELAVDARNSTGVQLIDRNDELCILYEKSNLQEQALSTGETATAMKLQQEKHDANVDVEECQKLSLAGYAPNAYCEQQLVRLQTQKLHSNEVKAAKEHARAAAVHAANFPSQLTYTTAEARPNAYIPEDLGIPKPYGHQAPFKPSQQGTTMRHIRVPQKRDIEI
ncbi:hypothetical protein BBO99_00004352 [Phytophthora kernoviae]|uniref:Cilia- and flagella-associated protein 58 central coiled coil domain-containing protein n=2 Tax=Phytophthora kernoviae TaxID=325452 RepID=A0A3R7J844_9STRA|nr:hypothetical protein G195_003083 [Phytophthora kernoviae 00238/432]KAG2526013.1 hypothetical protein JM16_002481 [Phytophthora kernoviae]KAG2527748.1 hypothetical protein JM18_002288 [Phytophthora kernoviae]RLN10958.1 hypothetical protein BBI17_000782 [Phytophthora kernoviae]RLN80648.1 hypothetical protein BBO99_00004352 [Phytophthora kernoviae]